MCLKGYKSKGCLGAQGIPAGTWFRGNMEGEFTGKEVYRQHFDPKGYLKVHMPFGSGSPAVREGGFAFILENLHKAFLLDGIQGETLIDIGSGPSIYQLLSACESFQEIIATEFLEQNREEMQKWLKKDPEAFDWTLMVKYICQLEGDREKWMEKEEKLRKTIKQVLKCDVTQANPLDPLVLQPASCVLTTFCLESACKDLPTYRSALKNVGSLVKPGGHLIFVVALRETYYMVGQEKFSCLYLEPEVVEEAVKEAGFGIVCFERFEVNFTRGIADAQSIGFLVAQKHNEA
ncbi:nicotinamide N-methyltransferase-like [Sceloporus undulatus]|uniref:nicotinamide N-methyltransferase-like n=1 Tax=Sceloporus undulatus TaxID=8520 RepID=UPI001C4D706E|nr:nicotinamide N-methyltransferase-like [Sceloporus undulatus]